MTRGGCLLIVLLVGCGKSTPPLTAGGQPVTVWLAELRKADPKARKKAVKELGHIGNADPAAIPAVIDALRDKDATVRAQAVLALLNIGPNASAALPVLKELQSDKDPTVRDYAKQAVERIGGGSPTG